MAAALAAVAKANDFEARCKTPTVAVTYVSVDEIDADKLKTVNDHASKMDELSKLTFQEEKKDQFILKLLAYMLTTSLMLGYYQEHEPLHDRCPTLKRELRCILEKWNHVPMDCRPGRLKDVDAQQKLADALTTL